MAAERRYDAAVDGLAEAQYALAHAIHRHLDEWLPAQQEVCEEHREDIRQMLREVTQRYGELASAVLTLNGLSSFPEGGSLVGWRGFGGVPGHRPSPIEDQVASAMKQVAQHRRTGGNFSNMVDMNAPTLIAALALVIEDGEA